MGGCRAFDFTKASPRAADDPWERGWRRAGAEAYGGATAPARRTANFAGAAAAMEEEEESWGPESTAIYEYRNPRVLSFDDTRSTAYEAGGEWRDLVRRINSYAAFGNRIDVSRDGGGGGGGGGGRGRGRAIARVFVYGHAPADRAGKLTRRRFVRSFVLGGGGGRGVRSFPVGRSCLKIDDLCFRVMLKS